MSVFRRFINFNRILSKWFDRVFLDDKYIIDGNRDYLDRMVMEYIHNNHLVYDVGGGKQPYFSVVTKLKLGLRIIGIDISAEELSHAPDGAYDKTIACDISKVVGAEDGDTVICQAVLEHVEDTLGAFRAIASLLCGGGRALIFVPSRNALFARLNLLLPQKIKEYILYTIYPTTRKAQGFPSYYTKCTPRDFELMATNNGMDVEYIKLYYKSSYFEFFFPLYAAWRLYQQVALYFIGDQAAETFSMVLVKRAQ